MASEQQHHANVDRALILYRRSRYYGFITDTNTDRQTDRSNTVRSCATYNLVIVREHIMYLRTPTFVGHMLVDFGVI